MIDKIDLEILKEVARLPHEASISEIIKPFRDKRSWNALYKRLRDLEVQGLLKTSKQRHCVFVEITEEGLKAQTKEA